MCAGQATTGNLEPGEVESVEGLLVCDVVENVEEIPGGEVEASLDGPCRLSGQREHP